MEKNRIKNVPFYPVLGERGIYGIDLTDFVLLLLLLIITIFPLFSGGFTTHDDAAMAITEWTGHTWEEAVGQSIGQGRFVFLWGFPLSAVPFVIDDRVWYLSIKYGSLCVLLIALYFSVYKLFRSSWIGFASIVFFLALIQNGWEHNALTSYAFIFNSYATVFLVSLGLFVTAIEKRSLKLAAVSGGLYFFSLGTELFVLFFPFYLIIVLSKVTQVYGFIDRLKYAKKYIAAIIIPLVLYLTIYVLWRMHFPSNYEGNSFSVINLSGAFKVILTYSLSAFPLASLKLYSAPGDPLSFVNSVLYNGVFSEFNVTHIIKPVIVGVLFAKLLFRRVFIAPNNRALLIGAVLAGIGVFLPNVLLGFTSRHPSWVGGGTYSYVYTYYSFIFASVFLALLLTYVNVKSQVWSSFARISFTSFVIFAMMILSFAVEVRNQYFAQDQKLAHRKWQLMDVVINSPAFKSIPNEASIAAPSLLTSVRGYAVVLAEDWNKYIKYKTGKDVRFIDTECKQNTYCYSLVFRQDQDTDNQFAVLSKFAPSNSEGLREMNIFFLPYNPGAILFGSFVPGSVKPDFKIDEVEIDNFGNGMFFYKLDREASNSVQVKRLVANVDIDPYEISISHFGIEPQLLSNTEALAKGIDFKQQEYPNFLAGVLGLSSSERWGRWSDAGLYPVVKLEFKKMLPKRFILEIIAGAFGPNIGAPVKVRVGSVEKFFIVNSVPQPYQLEFETDGKVDAIEIIPSQPTEPNMLNPESADSRKLGISLIALKIKGD